MKLNRWLVLSMVLNAVLMTILVRAARQTQQRSATPLISKAMTNRGLRLPRRPGESQPVVKEVNEKFHWSQVESEDYRIYAANLRAVGCPEETVRNIIMADIRDLFVGRVNELVDTVQGRFWEFMANKEQFEKLIEQKGAELKAMTQERDTILDELLGPSAMRPSLAEQTSELERIENRKQMLDFLPAEKAQRWLALEAAFERTRQDVSANQQGLGQAELAAKLKSLQEQKNQSLQQLLSPEELAEYKLRSSPLADLRTRLAGFDASEAELKEIIRIQEKFSNAPAAKEPLKHLLGEERFAQYERSQDGGYQELLQVADRFQLPDQTAVEAYAMRKAAEEAANRLRADATLPPEKRIELLQAIRAETERSLAGAIGPKAFEIYQKRSGQWLGNLNGQP